MSTSNSVSLSASGGCTCETCPVHKPSCPTCGQRGAHYCPGPSRPAPSGPWVNPQPYNPGTHRGPYWWASGEAIESSTSAPATYNGP